jgi:hypothetical protein
MQNALDSRPAIVIELSSQAYKGIRISLIGFNISNRGAVFDGSPNHSGDR